MKWIVPGVRILKRDSQFMRIILSLLALVLAATTAFAAPVDYEREVKPIFREHCAACHGVLKQNGSLRVDTGASLRQGGDSGPAVVPGKPADSELVKQITPGKDGKGLMPKSGPALHPT